MEYGDFLGNQQALINANNRLTEYAKERQNQRNALEEAQLQYSSTPQGSLQKALFAGSGAGAGATIGAGIGALANKPAAGALYGGLGGLAVAAGIGNHRINKMLDERYPERVEARQAVTDTELALSEAHKNYRDYKPVYERTLAHNAQLAHENPVYYQRVVDELGESYPISDVNSAIGSLEREKELNTMREEQNNVNTLEGQILQNQVLKEELEKQKLKNELRRQQGLNNKEAFTKIRIEMEKIASYYS